MTETIDFTKIDFPSDKLTIAQLRRDFPSKFDHLRSNATQDTQAQESVSDFLDYPISYLINAERILAELAYSETLGRHSDLDDDRESQRANMIECLIDLKIATGEHHAEQIIRDLEAQAAKQARERSGAGR